MIARMEYRIPYHTVPFLQFLKNKVFVFFFTRGQGRWEAIPIPINQPLNVGLLEQSLPDNCSAPLLPTICHLGPEFVL